MAPGQVPSPCRFQVHSDQPSGTRVPVTRIRPRPQSVRRRPAARHGMTPPAEAGHSPGRAAGPSRHPADVTTRRCHWPPGPGRPRPPAARTRSSSSESLLVRVTVREHSGRTGAGSRLRLPGQGSLPAALGVRLTEAGLQAGQSITHQKSNPKCNITSYKKKESRSKGLHVDCKN